MKQNDLPFLLVFASPACAVHGGTLTGSEDLDSDKNFGGDEKPGRTILAQPGFLGFLTVFLSSVPSALATGRRRGFRSL
ncbi:hypothetical protein FBY31_3264 [Arthrobacter sp. SLBN-100]|nr:hypothetical protein FBY31_3264 [Arthrobacter sp. SLBN-100]